MRTMTAERGFTLVETMVAITVLSIALVGPYIAVNNALNASYVARDKLIASSLAQEGMEYIRSIRDANYLNGRASWMTGLSGLSCYGATPTGYCTVDPSQGDYNTNPSAIASYSSASVPALYLSTTGLYNQQGTGTQTSFRRYVQLTQISTTEVRVTVMVTWTNARQSYSASVVDTLRDWL